MKLTVLTADSERRICPGGNPEGSQTPPPSGRPTAALDDAACQSA